MSGPQATCGVNNYCNISHGCEFIKIFADQLNFDMLIAMCTSDVEIKISHFVIIIILKASHSGYVTSLQST